MTKINKLHFNWVDYDIGDKDIHDLTEKTVLNQNDEIAIADSENIYQNKRVKFWDFQSSLSYDSEIEAGENLSQWDVVLNTFPCYSWDLVENSIDFGDTNTKVAIKQIANGKTMSSIDLYLKATSGSTATWLTVNIESDNNWKPSWTALVTKDIIDNFKVLDLSWTITRSSSSATLNRCAYVVWFSNDWKTLIMTDDSSNVYKYTLTTSFDISTATYTQIKSSYYLSRYAILVNNEYIIDRWTLHHFENFDLDTLTSVATNTPTMSQPTMIADWLSRDWKYRYIISAESSSSWTRYLDYYELSTPYDITTTWNKLWNIQMYNMSWTVAYGKMSIWNWFIWIDFPWNSFMFYKLVNWIPNWGTNSITTWSNISWKTVNYNWTYIYHLDPYWNQYTYQYTLWPTTLNTELNKYTVDYSTAPSLNKWDIFWITLTPTGGSGDRFSLWYVEKNTSNYNLATYDGSDWTDDTTKYPYAYWVANNAQFYLKASVENQWADTKQAMIVRKNTNAFGKVSYDFFGISKMLSNLLAWNSYYISSTPWQLTTASGWFKVGEALSSTDLLLTTE